MFCVWVEDPLGMFFVGSFPLLAIFFLYINEMVIAFFRALESLNPLNYGEGRCTPPLLPWFFALYSNYQYATHT